MPSARVSGVALFLLTMSVTANAQTNDGTTFPWCAPDVNRIFALVQANHPLAPVVNQTTVADLKVRFSIDEWPRPTFPDGVEGSLLLSFFVDGGTYYWWFDGKAWLRVKSEARSLTRSSLIYSIGTVEKLVKGSALIDLGDAHSLQSVPPFNKVTLFRLTEDNYVPVGLLTIAETYETFSLAQRSVLTTPQAGDVAIFVREMSDMKTVANHRDDFLREQRVRKADMDVYSTFRRTYTAKALRTYAANHAKWERSRGGVAGFLNGASFAEGGEEQLNGLLGYLSMLREDYEDGKTSLPAAGAAWNQAATSLFGPTVQQSHETLKAAITDEFQTDAQTPKVRDVQRAVGEEFFDRTLEERNLLSYLVATMLAAAPQNEQVWFSQRILRSQFAGMAEEELLLDRVRKVIRQLRN